MGVPEKSDGLTSQSDDRVDVEHVGAPRATPESFAHLDEKAILRKVASRITVETSTANADRRIDGPASDSHAGSPLSPVLPRPYDPPSESVPSQPLTASTYRR